MKDLINNSQISNLSTYHLQMYVVHVFVAKSYKLSDKYIKDKSS